MADSSTSSTSQSHLEKTQSFHFRATFETKDIQLVANIRKLHQHIIKLSIKNLKVRYITIPVYFPDFELDFTVLLRCCVTVLVVLILLQTKDLKCVTHLLSDKFRNISEEKKTFMRDLGFGGLMHIPPLRVHHQVLRELANNFKLGENRLETGYGSFKITPRKIGHALGINVIGDLFPQKVDYKKLSEDDKVIFRRFQGKTLKSLTDEMMDIGVETTDSDSSTSESETQEDSEDSPRKQPSKKGKKMDSKKRKKSQEDLDSDSESESTDETQSKKKKVVVEHSFPEEDQYYDGYSTSSEIGSEDLDELLRGNDEKSAAEGKNEADLQSTEGHYVSSETIPDVNLGSDDPSSQGRTEQSSVNKPAESIEPTDSNMMVMREQTPSEALAIVPIQVFVPVSQTTTVLEFEEIPETDFEPTPLLQIEGTTKTTPEPPQQLEESTPTLPPAPTKIYPAAEDAAVLMMMARTASYVPRTDPLPSFSLALTDSSQEETATQEGASTQEAERTKSPETANLIEELENLVQKIASSAAKEESKSPQIQRETGGEMKTYADGSTNEYDNMCTLIAQDKYILTRMHLASLQAGSYIEAEIVSAMCLILNQKNDKRFQEQVYCLPPILCISFVVSQLLQNMAISKHPNGEFISPKTNKEFRVEDYPSFIPFIDAKKLTSHPYIFAPVCCSGHWWLWVIDTTKRRFHILDPLHKKAPSDQRKQLNKFTGYVISRMRAYAGGEPLKKDEKEKEIKASYVNISGQKSSYYCAIYVMKWLELIEPENIKRGKYE
ncbi:uncharacterized protein DS421_10g295220 [Arachis hypogaea]|nr:uncharacterized protein DS421_10g295220 [Arachis hypogaea]